MPIEKSSVIWMDGRMVPWDEANIHVLTHGLHYGSGVFEGIRAYKTPSGPAVFRLKEHVDRLYASAHIFMIDIPFPKETIAEAIRAVVRENALEECYIRPIVFMGYGEMGLNPLACTANTAVAAWKWGTYLGDEGLAKGIKLKISSWVRHNPNSLPPAAKGTGMYMNSSLAKVEAVKAGYDEAILLSPQGYVSECTGENVFVMRKGRIFTPPTSAGALEGITQATVTALAEDLGYKVEVENILRSDLYTADEIFVCGTAAEVVPATSVDDRTVGDGKPGSFTKAIQQAFFAAVHGESDKHREWLDYVG